MVSRGMIKEKKTALKPRVKSFKVKVTRVKKTDLGKIMEERIVGERFGDELSLNTQLIVKESSPNGIQFGIMFNIVESPQEGDNGIALALTTFLSSVSDEGKL
ncbi:hypothetical protein V6N13_067093 [Hibiscus sabdariffa]|uniref:Uncharacterized protein n=1 Tax=Hibiscus sabdariffa TaxID=183260 RepID=A0ABR2DSD5_9ROSI